MDDDDLAPDSFVPGSVIDGKYEVKRVLGRGAMGAVVEATHLLRRARVALKFMSQQMADRPGVVERFLNEGVAASRINNEHVVKVLDVSRLPNGQPYMVMEFLDGEDLDHLLTREGAHGLKDVARAVHFILQVLRGLQVAHQAGIIHRDLKPANCFAVTNEEGEQDFIKLVDFGISKLQEPDQEQKLTREGMAMGTPLYVSPEQAQDATNVDARSDLYSVATMLYELLCGRTPFQAPTLPGLFMQLAMQTPTPLNQIRPDIPQGLADVVQKGLAKAPNDRYQSAPEMAAALAPYADARSDGVLFKLISRQSTRHGSPFPPGRPSAAPLSLQENAVSVPASTAFSGGEPNATAPGVVASGSKDTRRTTLAPSKTRAPLLFALPVGVALLGGGYALLGRRSPDPAPAPSAASELITREPALEPPKAAQPAAPTPPSAPAVDSALPSAAAHPTAAESSAGASVPKSAPPPPKPSVRKLPVTPNPQAAGAPQVPVTAPATPTPPPHSKPALNNIGLQD